MSKEKQYAKVQGHDGKKMVDVEIKMCECIMCGEKFLSPKGDLTFNYSLVSTVKAMGGFPMPLVPYKLCALCWREIYINSRDPNNSEHIAKAEEFKRLIRRESGASEDEYKASQEKKSELVADKTEDEWAKFQAEKNKKRKGD